MKSRVFEHRTWMMTTALYSGLIGWFIGVRAIVDGVSPFWLILTALVYFAIVLSVTVGYHRLFTHGTFKCSPVWQFILALGGSIAWYGSTMNWRMNHSTHHKHSDTDLDPQDSTWMYMVWKRYRNVKFDIRAGLKLAKNPWHRRLNDFYVLIAFVVMAIFALVSMLTSPLFFVFGYLMPIGAVQLAGGLHQVISHRNPGGKMAPRNLAFMEFIIPLCGEWMHGNHHEHPGRWNFRSEWWHLDIGSWLVRMIRTEEKAGLSLGHQPTV